MTAEQAARQAELVTEFTREDNPRYQVKQIPGLDLFYVADTHTTTQIGPFRKDRIVADLEAGDLEMQDQRANDPDWDRKWAEAVQRTADRDDSLFDRGY